MKLDEAIKRSLVEAAEPEVVIKKFMRRIEDLEGEMLLQIDDSKKAQDALDAAWKALKEMLDKKK